ncbi:hypothetical protein KKF91_09305 [Myxococcota bacterium]|nr:hypothetical protein [Myxococcota bacterium]MBU1430738.1 hypothetical protein [Myxococcota bacterium]MBU1900201.1 hypothetical protein [Myxococcota bacterium]
MSQMNEHILNQYFDDQLSPAERDAFEATLREDAEADAATQATMNELTQIGALLRAQHQREVAAADFSGFMAQLEARLPAAPDPVAATPERVASPETPRLSLLGGLRRFLFPALLGAAVALLAVFVLDRRATPSPAPEASPEGPSEVTVKAVHNQGNQTVLISMPAEDGGATVIWMLDEEEDPSDPLKGEDPI